ncbi:MAG: methyltransferase [Amycolatopsis sp.]|nr:methyltransferase [Amycolatopsis sp.]
MLSWRGERPGRDLDLTVLADLARAVPSRPASCLMGGRSTVPLSLVQRSNAILQRRPAQRTQVFSEPAVAQAKGKDRDSSGSPSGPGTTVASMVEDDALGVTRGAYDAIASTYAELFRDTLRDRPLDRAILGAFAEVVSASGDGQVADLGCGPGHITAYLDELGLAAFGVDASPAMIKLARQAYPGLRFDVGSMAALNIADGALSGALSRFSIIHTPPQELPAILAEFHRVLAPGAHLLVGFSATGDTSHLTQVFDHTVAPAYRWSPDHLAAMLRKSGLAEVARMIREPEPTDRRQFQEIHLLARRA